MSCADCEKAYDQACRGGAIYPYRWTHANVYLIACREHVLEVMEALTAAQDEAK